MRRVLIITDSLGAPRVSPETLYYEDTWPFKLKKRFDEYGIDTFIFTENGLDSTLLLGLLKFKLKLKIIQE